MISYLEKNKGFAIIFTILVALEIFVISSIPGSNFAAGGIDLSSLYHLLAFFLLNFFLLLCLNGKKNMRIKFLVLSITLSIAYAVLDEIHQIFVPLRFPSLTDVLVDAMGIFLSTLVYIYYKRKVSKD